MTKQSIADQQHQHQHQHQNQNQNHHQNRHRRSFFQLAGHKECFKLGLRPDTILKKSTGNEHQCLEAIQRDPHLGRFAPRLFGVLELSGETYLEMQDLLAGFASVSVMDVKMGYRTYREDELHKALRESQLRRDMFDKMVEVDESEPTAEERHHRAVTKPRYMIWRESVSSTASLGFRIEGMRLKDGTIDKDFKTLKDEEQIARAFIKYTKSFGTRLRYLHRLYDLKRALVRSSFFSAHELIGTSLLFIHDDTKSGVWLIDFAKTHPLPAGARVDHLNKWELGNHEDGYLAGVENLIRIFESITARPDPMVAMITTTTTTTTTLAAATATETEASVHTAANSTKAEPVARGTATNAAKPPAQGLEHNSGCGGFINNNHNSTSNNSNSIKNNYGNGNKRNRNGRADLPSPMKLSIRTS